MVAGLHKVWICVKITTMGLHPLKLYLAVGTGGGKFKACNSKIF